jgi:hypothetical protein
LVFGENAGLSAYGDEAVTPANELPATDTSA